MGGECDKCGEYSMCCECWFESKKKLPPLGEVVEAIGPKDWIYSRLGRDYFVLVEINSRLIWLTPHLNEYDYNTLEISHWRHIPADPKGRKPFVKIKMHKSYYEPKVYFEKMDDF